MKIFYLDLKKQRKYYQILSISHNLTLYRAKTNFGGGIIIISSYFFQLQSFHTLPHYDIEHLDILEISGFARANLFYGDSNFCFVTFPDREKFQRFPLKFYEIGKKNISCKYIENIEGRIPSLIAIKLNRTEKK